MNIRNAFGIAAWACLGACPLLEVRGAEFTPQKQTLVLPIKVAGKSAECTILTGPTVAVSAVAFSPDGKALAAGGYQEVLLWDLAGAKLLKRVGAGQIGGAVHAVAFLHSGQWLAVGEGTPERTGALRVFDVETGKPVFSSEEPGDVVYCLAVSPDGKLLVAGAADNLAYVWSVDDRKLAATLQGHNDWVLGASFSRDGKLLATAGADGFVQVWQVGSWTKGANFQQADRAHGVAFAPDGNILAVAVGGPGERSVRVRRRDNRKYDRALSTGAGMPLDVVWVGQKNRAYVPCSDGVVRVMDSNGRILASLSGHQDWVYAVALSPDESKLASAGADGTVKLWNAADGKLLATLVQLAPGSDQWLILSAPGYLATSSPGVISWKSADASVPADKLTGLLESPESTAKAIAGEKIAPPSLK